MPFKDPKKRVEAVKKSRNKKPDLYKALDQKKERARCQRGYHIKRRYGLTLEDYNKLLDLQLGSCAICNKKAGITITGKCDLHVDHDHVTGEIRGLLCSRCNMFIGFLEAPKDLLTPAKRYLENFKAH